MLPFEMKRIRFLDFRNVVSSYCDRKNDFALKAGRIPIEAHNVRSAHRAAHVRGLRALHPVRSDAYLGRMADARTSLDEFTSLVRGSLSDQLSARPFGRPADRERYLLGLSKAGLPEL